MAEEGLESKEIEEGIEEQKELDDDGDSKVNISSEGFTTNSPFRRSNFPRVSPYYRFSSWHMCAKDISWRNLNLTFPWTNYSFVKTRFLPPSIPYSPAVPQVGRISFILQCSFWPNNYLRMIMKTLDNHPGAGTTLAGAPCHKPNHPRSSQPLVGKSDRGDPYCEDFSFAFCGSFVKM